MRDRILLLRKISLIHSIKCNKTLNFEEAINSFKILGELKNEIVEDCVAFDLMKVSNYMATPPSVSEAEIKKLIQ